MYVDVDLYSNFPSFSSPFTLYLSAKQPYIGKSLPLLTDKIQAFRGDLTLILKSSYTSVYQMFCPSSTLVKRHILLA